MIGKAHEFNFDVDDSTEARALRVIYDWGPGERKWAAELERNQQGSALTLLGVVVEALASAWSCSVSDVLAASGGIENRQLVMSPEESHEFYPDSPDRYESYPVSWRAWVLQRPRATS
jgi:hypothetical protein